MEPPPLLGSDLLGGGQLQLELQLKHKCCDVDLYESDRVWEREENIQAQFRYFRMGPVMFRLLLQLELQLELSLSPRHCRSVRASVEEAEAPTPRTTHLKSRTRKRGKRVKRRCQTLKRLRANTAKCDGVTMEWRRANGETNKWRRAMGGQMSGGV